RLDTALLDAERARELLVDLGQHLLLDAVRGDLELRLLAAQAFASIVVGKLDFRGLRVAAREPLEGPVEILDDLLGPKHDGDLLRLAAFERFTVQAADEIDHDPIALLGLALDRAPLRPLLAQLLEHRVDVGIRDLDRRALELQHPELAERDLGEHLKRRPKAEIHVRTRNARERLDTGPAGGIELVVLNRLAVARADQLRQHFLTHLRAVVLAHDLARDLAG